MADTALPDLPLFYSYAKAAEIIGCSRMEIYNKVHCGQLAGTNLGSTGNRRRPAVTRASLVQYIDELHAEAAA